MKPPQRRPHSGTSRYAAIEDVVAGEVVIHELLVHICSFSDQIPDVHAVELVYSMLEVLVLDQGDGCCCSGLPCLQRPSHIVQRVSPVLIHLFAGAVVLGRLDRMVSPAEAPGDADY